MRILVLLLFFVSNFSLSCSGPNGGEEYNKLIKITPLTESNWYAFEVPENLDVETNELTIILAYGEERPGGIPIYDDYEKLKYEISDGKAIGKFMVVKRKNKPYINASWWPICCCPTMANTGFINVE